MTVLFGTVEYFEREILKFLNENPLKDQEKDHIAIIYSRLRNELLNDFICDEKIRLECLQNLNTAWDRFTKKAVNM